MRFDEAWLTTTVLAVRDLAPDIRELTLRPDAGAGSYPTGAHLVVQVPIGAGHDTRRYSLVGEAPVDGAWRIAVKRAAPGRGGSRFMWSLPVGARLRAMPPDSHFQLSRSAPSYLLVAGGIGITPLRGMASALLRRGAAFRMMYGGRSRPDMAYLAELEAELGDRLAVHADDTGPPMDLAAAFAALPPGGEAYVCGPLGLLEGAKRAWTAGDRPRAGLVYETFGSSGRFASEGFTVRVQGTDGVVADGVVTVPADATMLDALTAAGFEVLHDCRRGECGLCALDVVAMEGEVDHRDVFFSDHEHTENRKICVCVSRMAGGTVTVQTAYRGDMALKPGTRPDHRA